jgi:hypothetical protein
MPKNDLRTPWIYPDKKHTESIIDRVDLPEVDYRQREAELRSNPRTCWFFPGKSSEWITGIDDQEPEVKHASDLW